MHQYIPFSPVEINFFSYKEAIEYMEGLLSETDSTALFISENMLARLGLNQWLSEIRDSYNLIHVDTIPANPSVIDVYEKLLSLSGKNIARIIAIGGGSCIDLAKAISALYYLISAKTLSKQVVYDAIKNKEYLNGHKYIDIIALPTTSGTGSEVTKWATIWDMERKEKLSVDCSQIYPKAALIVPEFTIFMSERLTLSTGLDALSHAMEAFWSRSRTPLAQMLALSAIKQVEKYLPKVLENRSNLAMRQGMCIASLLAGLSFSITRTTACHSISYPLTMFFGIEHGFAAAITLSCVAERNTVAVPEISEIYSIFGGKDGFMYWLNKITQPVQSLRLSAFGLDESDIDLIIDKTFTQGRIDNNPVTFTPLEVRDILQQVF